MERRLAPSRGIGGEGILGSVEEHEQTSYQAHVVFREVDGAGNCFLQEHSVWG